ncbi:hypothetical protein ACFWG2_34500 [Streptomyces bacillaris]|uniref:hypothetical protein n=1 Tax=Streptomyces bacillaris TaxID=68179 RepID=UPI00364D2D52
MACGQAGRPVRSSPAPQWRAGEDQAERPKVSAGAGERGGSYGGALVAPGGQEVAALGGEYLQLGADPLGGALELQAAGVELRAR